MTPLKFNGIMSMFKEPTQIVMALFAELLVSLLVSSRISVYMKVSLIIFYVEKNINIIGTNHGGAMGFTSKHRTLLKRWGNGGHNQTLEHVE